MITCALAIARVSPDTAPGVSGRPLAVAALIAWLLTAGIGAYMLHTWVASGGLRAQRATGVGVPPAVVFGHAGAALTGLAIWAGYLTTGWVVLAWLSVTFIATAVVLGVCTVTLWTPYPVAIPETVPPETVPPEMAGPARVSGEDPGAFEVTDEMIAGLLANPFPGRRRRRLRLVPLIPVGHGFAALATFMLAVLAALSARLGMVRTQ
jgi:hypothetical protein